MQTGGKRIVFSQTTYGYFRGLDILDIVLNARYLFCHLAIMAKYFVAQDHTLYNGQTSHRTLKGMFGRNLFY